MITDLMQGTSLPSSVLTINVSAAAWTGAVLGATSPPHLLTVERRCWRLLDIFGVLCKQ